MKKIIALALVLVMALSLVACGGSGSGSGSSSGSGTKISVFWYDESDVYLSSVRDALNKELDALDGIEYDNQFAANDQSKQLDQIKTAVAGGAKMLVVNQVTSGAADTAEDILAAAGDIPVIFFNRAIGTDGSDLPVLEGNSTACFIGTDAPEAGHMQGKMIGDYLVEHYDEVDVNGDGVISYAMMKGDEANIEAIYRTQYGVEDANAVLTAAGKPALQYFDASNPDCYQVDQSGAWSAAAAKEYMDTNFVTYNEASGNMIELVICNNDGMAEGVIASLQEKGYNKEGAHVVPVFGVDATDNAKALIAEGAMTGTVKQDAQGMAAAIAQTVNAIAGGKTPADALASLSDDRFTIASDCATKLYVAYAPYTGE
ncbi:substrate-binding domain-containing protein [bacterium]|nr:substrate-binding domain-containing protein [bacterium]MDY4582640.1 substrate-binding domain-containing protein [Candidatus Faecousia sp.]